MESITTLTIASKKEVTKQDVKSTHMKIFSYPQLNIETSPFNHSRLTYGGNESTIKFFDFTSDLSYLMMSLQGIQSYIGIGNNANLLTHDRIRKALFYFVNELTSSDQIIKDDDKRMRIRESLERQKDSVALVLTEETLNFLKDLSTDIESKRVKDVFRRQNLL